MYQWQFLYNMTHEKTSYMLKMQMINFWTKAAH